MISHEELLRTLHYDPVTGHFSNLITRGRAGKAGEPAGYIAFDKHRRYSRIIIRIHKKNYKAHRLAWFYMTGSWPASDLDHKNGDATDNRWINLRLASVSQNGANAKRQRKNTSGYKGVSWSRRVNKWWVQIQKERVRYNVGYFDSKIEAHRAYKAKASELFGEFARA